MDPSNQSINEHFLFNDPKFILLVEIECRYSFPKNKEEESKPT